MTLLEKTYRQLRSAGLVHCAEAFSVDYLSKNKNWFSYQRCTGRDFSVDAAVQCLRVERQPLCPRATTILAGFQAAEVGVLFGFSG
jgi:hypothetical protein